MWHRRLRSAAFGICVSLPLLAQAQVLVVQGDDQDSYQEALKGIKAALPAVHSLSLEKAKDAVRPGDIVLSLGDKAALADYPSGVQVIASLLSDPESAKGKKLIQVDVLADAFSFMAKVIDLAPAGFSELAVFRVQGHFQDQIKYLGAAGEVSTIKVRASSVNNAGDLVGALRSLPGKAQVLWLAPDPFLLQSDNFKLISQFCISNKIALIAPLPLLARAGALAAVAPSYEDIGNAAGKAAQSLLAGKSVAAEISSNKCEVVINGATAQALGIKVSPKQGQILP